MQTARHESRDTNHEARNMEYAIETFSLTKIFSDWWGRNKVRAVDDLNLQVRRNEIFGLLGPNGSGKTTTIKLLLGLLYPTKGKALCLGGDSTDPKISARIGFLPEESYLYRYLSARETLDFYGRLFGLERPMRKMRVEALLDMIGLSAVASRPVGTFSKGMARRIGLAQALINDPDLLILDEPTTGLDPIGTRQMKDLFLQLAKRGKTILLCSHLLADVEDICDRIAILYGGRIQAKGRVKSLLQQTDKKLITTGSISNTAVERIKQIVQDERADCVVTSPMDKLETFFIKTVAAAQQQGRGTSGAVSPLGVPGTDAAAQISDFLVSQSVEESILDKLVSSPLSSEPSAQQPTTEKVKPVKTSEAKTDEQLLSELSEHTESTKAEPEEVKTQPVEPTEQVPLETGKEETLTGQVKKSILEKLTGRSKVRDKEAKNEERKM